MTTRTKVLLLVGYIVAWLVAYLVIVGFDFSFIGSYFYSGWTFQGEEQPTFIWYLSWVVFALLLFVYMVVKRVIKAE